jgi:hypothetical protein
MNTTISKLLKKQTIVEMKKCKVFKKNKMNLSLLKEEKKYYKMMQKNKRLCVY